MRQPLRPLRGFTIVEVLVVIAVVMIMVSLMIPAVGLVTDTRQQISCSSNQRTLHTAIIAYTLDHSSFWPSSREWVRNDGGIWDWWYRPTSVTGPTPAGAPTLWAYMDGNAEAYKCPTFLEMPQAANKPVAYTYAVNEYLRINWLGLQPLNTTYGVEQPASLLLLSDENPFSVAGYSNYGINNGALGVGAYNNPTHLVDSMGSFHKAPQANITDGSSNVLFVDGHVSLHHISESKEVTTPKRYK